MAKSIRIVDNSQINPKEAYKLEQKLLQPSETEEGVGLLLELGNLLGLKDQNKLIGIAESVTLDVLLNPKIQKKIKSLPQDSPLRLIVEEDAARNTLADVKKLYPGRENYHYGHGIAVESRGAGMGTKLLAERLRKLVGENDLLFGYTLANPANIALLNLYFKFGGVIDKVENDAYGSGQPYFRVVLDNRAAYSDPRTRLPLTEWYLSKIKLYLSVGFVGTRIDEDGFLVFKRRLHP